MIVAGINIYVSARLVRAVAGDRSLDGTQAFGDHIGVFAQPPDPETLRVVRSRGLDVAAALPVHDAAGAAALEQHARCVCFGRDKEV